MKLRDLIDSTRQIRVRQYPTSKVGSIEFKYVARSKMFYIYSKAFPLDKSSRRFVYPILLVFKGVSSSDNQNKKHPIPYSGDGVNVDRYIEKLTVNMDVMVRCRCEDYYFMWQYWNKGVKSLIGAHKKYVRKTTTYPVKNPLQHPGLCKHQLAAVKLLMDNNIIVKNVKVNQYVNRIKR